MDNKAKYEFYRYVRDQETAGLWHKTYTPWLEENEIKKLVEDYSYCEIQNEYEK